jgi:hypothetical protein
VGPKERSQVHRAGRDGAAGDVNIDLRGDGSPP